MPDYNSLEAKLEAAYLAVIAAANVGTDHLFAGQEPEDIELQAVIVHAMKGEDIDPNTGTGIYRNSVAIAVLSNADIQEPEDEEEPADPEEVHRSLVAKVRDAALQDNVIAALNGAGVSELTVVDVLEAATEHTTEGRRFRDVLQVTVIAAAAAI